MGNGRIYTKKGDKGFTFLATGERVAKTDPRIEAYGNIDELGSFVAWLNLKIADDEEKDFLSRVQSVLFALCACLSLKNNSVFGLKIETYLYELEQRIDEIQNSLPALKNFVIPGGDESSVIAHVCRTVCRRAERSIYKIPDQDKTNKGVLMFMNRLSDYFFVLSRKLCLKSGQEEIIWGKSCL